MKRLTCACGQVVYFDNHRCTNCNRELAFDPDALIMQAEQQAGSGLQFCANRDGTIRCNWLAAEPDGACLSCRMSRIIPVLSKPENHHRWRKLEKAKRRLLYDLLRLELPVDPAKLTFVFKEDRRTNPDVHDDHVAIGHRDGVITINAAEADAVYREQMRVHMNEPYRTLLGHFRHESGHYFFDEVVDDALKAKARELFGDESTGYDEALEAYYASGAQPGWEAHYISSYASAHPAEDWAECWAHYLHIRAVLETADATGLKPGIGPRDWHSGFVELAIAINEVLRSMGLPDAYPFVITAPIAAKIEFVHAAVERFTGRRAGLSSAARG